MHPLLFILGLLAVLGPLSVQAAFCRYRTGGNCEATDYTLKSCTDNVCDCKDGYAPIPSGCAMKLGKPKVTFQGERTGEVIKGANVTLVCSVTGPSYERQEDVSKLSYEWKKNGQVTGGKMNTHMFTANNDSDVGKFSCKAKLSDTQDSAIDSPESDNVTIVLLGDDYITTPLLTASGTHLIKGARLVLTCGQSESGVDYLWYKKEQSMPDSLIVLQRDRIIQFDNFTNAIAGEYYCIAYKDTYEVRSNTVTVEMSDTTRKPSMEREDDATNFGEKGDYQLMCKTLSATAGMYFYFMINTSDVTYYADGNLYKITNATADKHNGNYTCIASFDGKDSEVSDKFEVKVTDAGRPCTAASGSTDTVCSGDEYTGKCDNDKRCECKGNYVKKGSVCASHALISSAILVIAASIFSRLF